MGCTAILSWGTAALCPFKSTDVTIGLISKKAAATLKVFVRLFAGLAQEDVVKPALRTGGAGGGRWMCGRGALVS